MVMEDYRVAMEGLAQRPEWVHSIGAMVFIKL